MSDPVIKSQEVESITLPAAADFHIHLRSGPMMNSVVPQVYGGGVGLVYVMPNLVPPISSTAAALKYRDELRALDPRIEYFMTLYLGPELTPEEIRKAAAAGIKGVKSYPRGVTTNSDAGIESYEVYYPIFAAMEETGMVLNLHGEIPSDHARDVCVMNSEEHFLEHLAKLHADFPRLRIVLEHATTRAAVEMVKSLGETVGCTITVHHLYLTVDDWAGRAHHFCKPVAKFPHDRQALRDVIREGHPRFFLGTDSAPHPKHLKEAPIACAGVYTSSHTLPYLATLLEEFGALDQLEGFACRFGRTFYGAEGVGEGRVVRLVKRSVRVPECALTFVNEAGKVCEVVPFLSTTHLPWSIEE